MRFAKLFCVLAIFVVLSSPVDARWRYRCTDCQPEQVEQAQPEQVNPAPPADVDRALLRRINAERIAHGLAELVLSPIIHARAIAHCRWMGQSGRFQHSGDGAENIAMGQADADEAVDAWMNSPGHRANILNPSYTHTGITGVQDSGGRWYWCQQFE